MMLLLILLGFSQTISEGQYENKTLDGLFDQLTSSTQAHILSISGELEVSGKPLRIQIALFREDLIWQARGFTKPQITLIVTLTLYKAIGPAEQEAEKLVKEMGEEPGPEQKERFESLVLFVQAAQEMVDRETEKVKNMKDYELKFYY